MCRTAERVASPEHHLLETKPPRVYAALLKGHVNIHVNINIQPLVYSKFYSIFIWDNKARESESEKKKDCTLHQIKCQLSKVPIFVEQLIGNSQKIKCK